MAPTLDWIEGFEHQADSAVAPSGTAVYAVLNRAAGTSYPAGRLGGVCVQLDGDATTATYVRQDPPATTMRVFAGYFKIVANPAVDNATILLLGGPSTVTMAQFRVRTVANGGFITGRAVSATAVVGPNVCDGAWHLLEFRLDTTGGTAILDWRVDGVAQTQSTSTLTSQNSDRLSFGSQVNADDTTVAWDDCIGSVTTADYTNRTYWTSPVATVGNGWRVALSNPAAEGTDVTGTNSVVNQAGSGANAYQAVDDWASGAADGNTTYLTYQSTTLGDAASNYAEFTMDDRPAGIADIWKAVGNGGAISASTTASSMIMRVRDVDGSANLGDVIPGDISETTTRYMRLALTTPASGWLSAFNNLRVRVGFSPDTNPLPRITAVGIQYVYPVDAKAAPGVVAGVTAVATPTVVAHATTTPSTVAGITAVATPTVVIAVNATATPSVIAAVAAVATPSITSTAAATPAVVAGVTAVPTPTVIAESSATATPSVVTGVAALPQAVGSIPATATPTVVASVSAVATPTATAGASATPSKVSGVGALPAPSPVGTSTATPAKVSAVAAVATPNALAGAVATPSVIPGAGSVPTPTITVDVSAHATPSVVAGIAALPAPSVIGTAFATPAKVSSITAVPTPAAHANANATPAVIEGIGIAYDAVATSDHSADATPAVIEAVAEVTTPVVIGDANAEPDVIAAVTFIGAHAVVDNSWRGSAGDEWEQEDATGWEASGASEWSQTG